jgi:hypothetical protein
MKVFTGKIWRVKKHFKLLKQAHKMMKNATYLYGVRIIEASSD